MSNVLEEPKAYFMRGKEVCQFIGMTPAARDKAIREGLFPRPFRIGVRAKAWKREEIMHWIEDRDRERESFADPAVPTPLTDAEKVARFEAAEANARG